MPSPSGPPKEPLGAPPGTSEHSLREARVAKAQRVRDRGEDPFTNDIDPGSITDLGTLRRFFQRACLPEDRYDPTIVEQCQAELDWTEGVTVAGRVVAARSFGKASFLRLRDWAGEIQLFCRKDVLGDAYTRLDDIDVADHVLASGRMMVTKKGELSVEVTQLRLLTKAYRPLPEKWHGLSDVEVRYRRRYVDLAANENVRTIFRARSCIVRALRSFFDQRGFVEVETPTMNTLVGGATARPFLTHHNALNMKLFLRIAPELYLKRLVVGGLERVYEVGRCYRNEGLSTRHNPEFTMLEFYMAYARYETLMDMTEVMLRHVDQQLAEAMPEAHAVWLGDRPFRFDVPFARHPMRALLERCLAADAPVREELPTLVGLRAAGLCVDDLGIPERLMEVFAAASRSEAHLDPAVQKQLLACENHGERVFLLYELVVEPNLPVLFTHDGKSVPVFVVDHPVEVSPLARRHAKDPSLVERFELFVHGRELCNAFSELNDPEDQAARFRDQVAKKDRGVQETMDYDEDYLRALEHGLPPTAGFGMGIDRLTMMLTAQDSIREVILFPLLRPER